jgi:hypothetical protein
VAVFGPHPEGWRSIGAEHLDNFHDSVMLAYDSTVRHKTVPF